MSPAEPSPSGGRPRPIRLVQADRIPALLSMDACIEVVEDAFRSLARGEVLQPLRTVLRLADGESAFLAMPGHLGGTKALGAKLLTLFPANQARGLEVHHGVVVLFDASDGSLRAVVDAGPLTAIRTAAASAVATRALAREDASELAILGSGVQARSHVEAMLRVRPIRRVRAWSPTRSRLDAFVEEVRRRHGVNAEASESPRAAVREADLICTVTASPYPVLGGEWLEPGTHVNAVGASTPETRELDTAAVTRARFYVDRRDSALAEAGDFLLARREGGVADEHIVGEIGDVLEGRVPGRRSDREITVFKSLGLAVQDLAAAARIVEELDGGAPSPRARTPRA
jgi:alanine dehydrogenase